MITIFFKIIKNNFNFEILLDHKSTDLNKSSSSQVVPRREGKIRRTLTLNFQSTSKRDRKADTNGFPMGPSTP